MAKIDLANIDTGISTDVQKLLQRAFSDGIDCDIPISYGNKIKFETVTEGVYVEVYVDAAGKLVLPEETSTVYNDSVYMYFGSGSDIGMAWDGADFHITAALDDSVINVGDGTLSLDLKWFGASAAAYIEVAASDNLVTLEGMDLILMDSDFLYFGDAKDVQIRWDGADLDILALADNSVIKIGNGTNSFDVWIYGATVNDNIIFSASAKTLALDGIDLYLEDDDILAFGDSQDVTIAWAVGGGLNILAETNNSVITLGSGTLSFDIKIFGATTADYVYFNASENSWEFGVDDHGIDVTLFGAGTGKLIKWVQANNVLDVTATIEMQAAEKLQFRDPELYIYSSTNGQLDIIGDAQIQITAPTIDLEASTGIVLDGDVSIDGIHTFATGTGAITLSGEITLADAVDMILNVTTGTKIGTAVGQKLGFWNVTPVEQPASADQVDQGAMTFAHSWNGSTYPSLAEGDKIIADLAAIDTLLTAMRTALVATGIMKGLA